jgi:flavodoxin
LQPFLGSEADDEEAPMKVAVVYESWFGNTREVAEAIAEEFRGSGEVLVASVDDPMPPLDGVDLLVVGAPTHIHGLSSGTSRKSAVEELGTYGDAGRGARGWLKELPSGEGRLAAAFDTRIEKPVVLVGSAARGIAKRLRRRGFELAADPESFFVVDSQGPLKDGELRRAETWAQRLAEAVPVALAR